MAKETNLLEGLPGLPSTRGELDQLMVLYYRHGNNPRTQDMFFIWPGEFKKAIDRGRQFCERMSWKFISVRPFLSNLEDIEKRNTISSEVE